MPPRCTNSKCAVCSHTYLGTHICVFISTHNCHGVKSKSDLLRHSVPLFDFFFLSFSDSLSLALAGVGNDTSTRQEFDMWGHYFCFNLFYFFLIRFVTKSQTPSHKDNQIKKNFSNVDGARTKTSSQVECVSWLRCLREVSWVVMYPLSHLPT